MGDVGRSCAAQTFYRSHGTERAVACEFITLGGNKIFCNSQQEEGSFIDVQEVMTFEIFKS